MAIAYDTSVDGGQVSSSPQTWSHTCSGSDRLLLVFEMGSVGDTSGTQITGITYNGVAMTRIVSDRIPSGRRLYLYYLINPASGSHTVSVTAASVPDVIGGVSVSYTGCDQTTQPDASTTDPQSSVSSTTTTLVTTVANCWTVLAARGAGTSPTAGSGSTLRIGATADNQYFFDSNGPIVSAGSTSMSLSWSPSANVCTIMASLKPAATVASVLGRMFSVF